MSDTEIVTWVVERHGTGTVEQVRELKERHGQLYRRRAEAGDLIVADTVALVERLAAHHIPLGIVTGAQRQDVMAVLGRTVIGGLLDAIVSDEDVRAAKTDPEGYLLGARLLGVPPGDVLVFEDSVVGVRAAHSAGMRCIAVGGDDPSPELRAFAPCVIRELSADLVRGLR